MFSIRQSLLGSPLGIKAMKTIAFDGTANKGATGTTTLFTVTGKVLLNVFAYCTEDLVSAGGGTLEIGTSSLTSTLADQQLATAIDNHEVWHDNVLEVGGQIAGHIHVVDQNVILTVATGNVTDGTLEFYAFWSPVSPDGNVVAA